VKDLKEHPDIQDIYDTLLNHAIKQARGDEDVESQVCGVDSIYIYTLELDVLRFTGTVNLN
jgi:hypothetical protein